MGYKQQKTLIGIDEAGRGPLAGPVAVGVVVVPKNFDWKLISGVGDSKQVSPKKRAEIFYRVKELKKEGLLDFVVVMGSAKEIDKKGIAVVIKGCIERALNKVKADPKKCFVKLDGSLKAPLVYSQETIIKGDAKELVIGLASICAKETRDTYMREIAMQFPAYDFAVHKGYGTKRHRDLIKRYGVSDEHRQSFCRNCI
jgi:ribonuclease HII